METLEDEHSTITDDRSTQKAKISLPEDIIEAILSRLPIKSILRFKSVSKPWLSLTSTSSFTNLHSAVGPRTTALFFTALDTSTGTRYFFSGAHDDGSVANLMKLDNCPYSLSRAEHLNGLVCFTPRSSFTGTIYCYVLNPSTHKFFELPDPSVPLRNYTGGEDDDMCYLFGFDELSNEHKVLYIDVELIKPTTVELMIFSMSSYSWRKISVDLPVGISKARWWFGAGESVCVNSVIHLMLRNPVEILAFDLQTEKFSIVMIPADVPPEATSSFIYPYTQFVKVNGLLGVACLNPEKFYKVDIWILQDYQNRVWVRETVRFPPEAKIQYGGGGPSLFGSINMDETIFTPRALSEDSISVPIYIKSRCFKSVQLTLGHRFQCPKSVTVEQIKCYVESLIPLHN